VEATAQGVMALQPDVAIIATGSEAVRAEVPGAGARGVLTVSEVLRGAADGARNVLIVDREGRAPAFVAADYLASRGIGVTFVATAPQVAPRLGTLDGVVLYQRLTDQGVVFRAGLDLVRLEGAGAILRDLHSGAETREGPYGAVVVAAGGAPVNHLADALRGLVNEIHVVGAASTATSIREATVDGARVARLI